MLAVACQFSDRHQGGRSVWILTFAYSLRLVYKPRSLRLARAYSDLLAWCNENDVPLPFKILRVIDRGTYGWFEFVAAAPCRNPEEAALYSQRSGALICLLSPLRSCIASGRIFYRPECARAGSGVRCHPRSQASYDDRASAGDSLSSMTRSPVDRQAVVELRR